jgi:hypothetical protein
MSDAASWGSSSTQVHVSFAPRPLHYIWSSNRLIRYSQHDNGTSSNQDNDGSRDRQEYSTLDKYIKQRETHEQAVLGHGTTKVKKEVKKHEKKMKKKIKVIEKKLPK